MLTIIKFHLNTDKGPNTIISRTLLKTAVIDRQWKPEDENNIPGVTEQFESDGELWKVKVLRDTASGRVAGCFIVQPICKVEPDEIVHLIPGLYETENYNGLVVLTPNKAANWMLPLENKKLIAQTQKAYAVIVRLGGRTNLGRS
ncbi:MAG: hypothetical protein WC895_02595 [Candidatus Shapirobacteria bacterium]|jgi:hypothetical protein